MFTIGDITVKAGATFLTKDGGRKKFAIGTVHRDKTVTYLPEKNLMRYSYSQGRGRLSEVRVSHDEFENNVLRKWVTSQKDIQAEKSAQMRDAFARFAQMAEDYNEAVRIDIVFDAANGVSAEKVLERMNALIEDEKAKAWESGHDEGESLGRERGRDERSYDYSTEY